jgi:hypothetical protein
MAALAAARNAAPEILKTLIAARPRQPRLVLGELEAGSPSEAWFHRMDWLPLWAERGALDWLMQAVKSLGSPLN